MSSKNLLSKLHQHLEGCQQVHLLQDAEKLTFEEIARFFEQVKAFSQELIMSQRKAIETKIEHVVDGPWLDIAIPLEPHKQGSAIAGRSACVILAGGQGSRLGWHGPKALFPIFPETNLTLLQILLGKVRDASLRAGYPIPVAVMTSPQNQAAIKKHAEENDFYGLMPGQLQFFAQNMLPLVDENGDWFLEKPGAVAMGPDGNGGVFSLLKTSGILQEWKMQGVETITMVPIDNPLASPFDTELGAYQREYGIDVIIKCIKRSDPEEKMGVFAKSGTKLQVIEYTELSAEQKYATSDSDLNWPYANINLFSFSLSFIEKVSSIVMPWHIAKKQAHSWLHGKVNVFKCETFLFDVLPLANNPRLLLYSREKIYAPLKNKEGEKSPASVRAALRGL